MKKITVILIAICFINISFSKAQTNKGRVLLGASSAISLTGSGPNILSIGYSKFKTKIDTANSVELDIPGDIRINLLPRFGYFLFNNFVIGADICLGYSTQNDLNSEVIHTIYGGGPFIRYYFPTQKIRPFIEVNAVFASDKTKFTYSGNISEFNSSISIFGVGSGIAFPIGEKSTIDLVATYNSITEKRQENNPYNQRMITSNFGIRFGFTFYLGSEE